MQPVPLVMGSQEYYAKHGNDILPGAGTHPAIAYWHYIPHLMGIMQKPLSKHQSLSKRFVNAWRAFFPHLGLCSWWHVRVTWSVAIFSHEDGMFTSPSSQTKFFHDVMVMPPGLKGLRGNPLLIFCFSVECCSCAMWSWCNTFTASQSGANWKWLEVISQETFWRRTYEQLATQTHENKSAKNEQPTVCCSK